MIKRFGLFYLVLVCLTACNNTTTDSAINTTTEKNAIPAEEKLLRDAITKYPDSLLLKENLIQYFRENSNYGQAIIETDKELQKDSANDRLWDIKAALHILQSDTADAIKALQKAISINRKPAYVLSLGLTYAQLKNASALQMADILLNDPKAKAEKQAQFIKGFYYAYLGNYKKSIAYYDTCLAIDYTYIDAYKEKAVCLYELAKYNEAIETLQKAVSLKSTYDEAFFWLGRCYQKLNMPKEAQANYEMALQIDPDYAEAKDALSRLK